MSQPMPYTTPGRVLLPFLCWIRMPGTEIRCRLRPHADGNHRNMIARVEWPNRGPEPQ